MPGSPVSGPLSPLSRLSPYTDSPAQKPRRASLWVAGVVMSAFAVLCGTGFAVFAISAADGADSPEAAVQKLFGAIDREDAIGVLESLPPSERDVIKQPTIDIVNELQRLGLLQSFDLAHVPGADISVTGLTLASEPVGSNSDLMAVKLTGGTISGTIIPDAVPIGDTLHDIITDDFGEEIKIKPEHDSSDLADDRIRIITLKEDGGWHVSLFYSIAEAIRDGRHSPPVLGGGPAPLGSPTPDGALHDLVSASLNLDAERVVSLLPPDEMRAVYDYAPLFLPKLRDDLDDIRTREGFTAKVNRLDARVEGEGGVRRVIVDGFDIEGSGGDITVRVTYDGNCYTFDETRKPKPRDSSTSRPVYSPTPQNYEYCADKKTEPNENDPYDFGMLSGMSGPYAVVVVERNGRWYVSPTRTLFDALLTGLRKVTPEDLREWSQRVSAAIEKNRNGPPIRIDGSVTPGTTPGTKFAPVSPCIDSAPSSSIPQSGSLDRQMYLFEREMRTCVDGSEIEYPDVGRPDHCYFAYEQLTAESSDDEWAAADEIVAACRNEQRVPVSNSGTIVRAPTTIFRTPSTSTSTSTTVTRGQ